MADHIQDEEQVEALKRWWDENGRSTVVAVGLAIAGTLGWQQYQAWDAGRVAAASDLYADVLRVSEDETQYEALRTQVGRLTDEHSGTTYAVFAAMQLAAHAVDRGEWSEAESQLKWALEQQPGPRVRELIRLRLARVMAAAGNEGDALVLFAEGSDVYPVSFAMAEGDLHLSQGREAEALAAYRRAESAALLAGNVPGMLTSKINTLVTRGVEATDQVL